MTGYPELPDGKYSDLRKTLLKTKGSNEQSKFLEKVRDSKSFVEFVDTNVPSEKLDREVSNAILIPTPLTEFEFKNPPADTAQTLYKNLQSLPPARACRSTFWGKLTLEHIRHGHLSSFYLASNGGNSKGGKARIDQVLSDRSEKRGKLIDSCVRTVIRKFSSLPERGTRSVYVDCPLARTWWRERMVIQSAHGDADLVILIRNAIGINQTYWENLVSRIISRNSTFGSANVRGAFFRIIGNFLNENPESDLANTKTLQRICRVISAHQGKREISILDDRDLEDLISTIVCEI